MSCTTGSPVLVGRNGLGRTRFHATPSLARRRTTGVPLLDKLLWRWSRARSPAHRRYCRKGPEAASFRSKSFAYSATGPRRDWCKLPPRARSFLGDDWAPAGQAWPASQGRSGWRCARHSRSAPLPGAGTSNMRSERSRRGDSSFSDPTIGAHGRRPLPRGLCCGRSRTGS